MPLLDINSAQPSLQINLSILREGSLTDSKALASSFIFRNGKRPVSSRKPVDLHLELYGHVRSFEIRRGRIFITAVATFESEGWIQKQDVKKGNKNSQLDSNSIPMQPVSVNKESEEMDEKERLRRMRISKANKGIMPWNKGRKHSSETRERIRERTRIAMQNYHKRRDKGEVKRNWERRREVLMLQEYCHFEWKNLIAEASRIGFPGEEELQWDSYKILNEQLHMEWLESVERRKKTRPKGCKRAPKTLEQRRRISAAISAKWTNPEYREKISTAKSRNRGTTVGFERKPKIKQSSSTTKLLIKKKSGTIKSPIQSHPEKKASASQSYNGSKTDGKTQQGTKLDAQYKNPSENSKLEMIKNIRAQKESADTRKAEAIERARSLIAEAEMAMNALELAAEKSPIARASLAETRKIVAEAILSLESLKTRQARNVKNGEEASDAGIETVNHAREGNDAGRVNINGIQTLASSTGKSCDYCEDIVLNNDMEDAAQESGTSPVEQPNPNGKEAPPKSSATTKKWVRGRLIQVSGQV